MSRAAMRREARERSKHKNDKGFQAMDKGRTDGKAMALSVVGCALHDRFGWGAQRLYNLLQTAEKQSGAWDQKQVQFACTPFAKKITEELDTMPEIKPISTNAYESIYLSRWEEFFITISALLQEVLFDKFGFGEKRNSDIKNYVCEAYWKFATDKSKDATYWMIQLEKKGGIKLE